MSIFARVFLIVLLLCPSFLFAFDLEGAFSDYIRDVSHKNFFWALFLFFIGGLLTNLTPCVYPLIPITLSIFQLKKFNDSGRRKLFPVFYALGIFITFFILGLLSSYFGVLFGWYFSNPWFQFFVFLFLFFLGFMMLDIISAKFIQNALHKLPLPQGSYPYFLVSGLLSGLLSTPCTGPILGLILIMISQMKSIILGSLFMSLFSLGFSLPYVFLGFLGQSLTRLPRLGKGLFLVKIIFASLMFSLGIVFLSNSLPKELSSFILQDAGLKEFSLIVIILAVSILFFFLNKISTRTFKFNTVILMTLFFLFSLNILFHKKNNSEYTNTHTQSFSDRGFGDREKLESQITLLLFTSAGCRLCEKIIPKLNSIASIVHIMTVDLTEPTFQNRRLMEHYTIIGVPTLFVFREKPKDLLKQTPRNRFMGEMKIKNLIEKIKRKDYKDLDLN